MALKKSKTSNRTAKGTKERKETLFSCQLCFLFKRLNIKHCLVDIRRTLDYAKQSFIRYPCQTNIYEKLIFFTPLTNLYFYHLNSLP